MARGSDGRDGSIPLFAALTSSVGRRGLAPEADPVTELGPGGGRPPARLSRRVTPPDPPHGLGGPPAGGAPERGREEQQKADGGEQDDRRRVVVRGRTGRLAGGPAGDSGGRGRTARRWWPGAAVVGGAVVLAVGGTVPAGTDELPGTLDVAVPGAGRRAAGLDWPGACAEAGRGAATASAAQQIPAVRRRRRIRRHRLTKRLAHRVAHRSTSVSPPVTSATPATTAMKSKAMTTRRSRRTSGASSVRSSPSSPRAASSSSSMTRPVDGDSARARWAALRRSSSSACSAGLALAGGCVGGVDVGAQLLLALLGFGERRVQRVVLGGEAG